MSAPRVHHLNCATMCPASARLVNGTGGWFQAARMVAHCLLVESSAGLLLVDTGLGTADLADPRGRLGRMFLAATRPRLDPDETAVAHARRLGFQPADVRHIVPTHLDLDHAGGLSDFPDAEVHVYALEHEAAMTRATRMERNRYREAHWAHGPRWAPRQPGGEAWFGFNGVHAIPGCDEVLLIPLHGHTRGHCGVAVRTAGGWLLHAGDAYFHHREVHADPPRSTPGLSFFQRVVAMDDKLRRENQARLWTLAHEHPEVRVFSAHCPVEFDDVSRAADRSVQPDAAPRAAAGPL